MPKLAHNAPMPLPQIHLRDLFWLVLFCALLVTWWLDRRSLTGQVTEEKRRFQDLITRLNDADLRNLLQDRATLERELEYSGTLVEIVPDSRVRLGK